MFLVVFQMKDVPHFLVNSLPLMCFLARRDNWDIVVRSGAKFQTFPPKKININPCVFDLRSLPSHGGGGLGRAVPRCRHIGCVVLLLVFLL